MKISLSDSDNQTMTTSQITKLTWMHVKKACGGSVASQIDISIHGLGRYLRATLLALWIRVPKPPDCGFRLANTGKHTVSKQRERL